MKKETFRDLVERFKETHENAHGTRFSSTEVAGLCGISVTHLYNLMKGAHLAYPVTVDKIARGLGFPRTRVLRAIQASVEAERAKA